MPTNVEKRFPVSIIPSAIILLIASFYLFAPPCSLADSLSIDQVNIETFPNVMVFLQMESKGEPIEKSRNDQGRRTTDLYRDIQIFEDSAEREILEIRHLASSVPDSAVVMLLDVSGSMRGKPFREMKKAVLAFIAAMKTGEKIAIVTFADEVTIDLDFTADRDALRNTIDTLKISGKITVLYNAISQATDLYASRRFQGRKAMVVFSDGKDEGSRIDYTGLMEKITRSNIPIYSIGFSKIGNKWLRHMASFAETTNGRYLYAPKAEDLSDIYKNIETRIRDTYVLVYASLVNREDAHDLRIQWKDTEALKRFYLPEGFFRDHATPTITPPLVPEPTEAKSSVSPKESGEPGKKASELVQPFPLRKIALFTILLALLIFYVGIKIRNFRSPPEHNRIKQLQGNLQKIAAATEKEIQRFESNQRRELYIPTRRDTPPESTMHVMEKLFLESLAESNGDEIRRMKTELNEEEVFFAVPTYIQMLKNTKGRQSAVIGNVLRKIASVVEESDASDSSVLSDAMNNLEYWENWWEKSRSEKTAKIIEKNLLAETERKREADKEKVREALEKRKERIQKILAKQTFSTGMEVSFLGIDPYREDSLINFDARIEKRENGQLFLSCKRPLNLETLIAPSDRIHRITPFWDNIRIETIIQAGVFHRIIAIEEKEAGAYSVLSAVLKSFEEEITIDQLFERVKAS